VVVRFKRVLAPVVQMMDSAMHHINHYPADKYQENQYHYPQNGDSSIGLRYAHFEQIGPYLVYC